MNLDRIKDNLQAIQGRIAAAAARSGREPSSVRLVAVTKRNPPEMVRPLVALGVRDLGENYPQELWSKAEALADLTVRWHLIGHLQGNKARKTLPMVGMVHAVDSLKLLEAINLLPDPPPCCLQVNASGEESKHGWDALTLIDEAQAIAGCRSVPVVGLMTIAGYGTDNDEARPNFVLLRELRDRFRLESGLALPELSMGMSGDFEAAIEEGSTLVRVGSALFDGVAG